MSLDSTAANPSPLIVIGVNRSGTSALAAAIKALGYFFGLPEDLPDQGLRLDYEPLENRRIVDIGGSVLRILENESMPARRMPENWREFAELPEKVSLTARFLREYFGEQTRWAWKDPRTTLMLPFFESAFELVGARPTYLMPIRHPMEVAVGLSKRQGLTITEGIGYWIHYTLTGLTEVQPERLEMVPFREFIQDPRLILERIFVTRGLECPTDQAWARVREVVRPELDRTRDGGVALPSFAAKCWNVVRPLAHEGGIQEGSSEQRVLNELAREWRELTELTRLPAIAVGEVRWLVAGLPGSSAFSGERTWHSCVVSLPHGFKDQVDFWFLPRYREVHIRNLRFSSPSGEIGANSIGRDGAFVDRSANGDVKLLTFGPSEHLTIPIPRGANVTDLKFEFQVSAGKQAALKNAQQLTSAFMSSRAGPAAPGLRPSFR